jgi:hypothetical protein
MLQLRIITSQRGAVIICLDDYMYKKDSDVAIGVSWRCKRRNCKGRGIININNTKVLKKVNHDNEHEDIANNDFIHLLKMKLKIRIETLIP